MSADEALLLWGQLQDASPFGCRIHLTGGEPFGRWEMLLDLCRQAKSLGLKPLEKIETNAFWATDANLVANRIKALKEAGMAKLFISADPYHQQYVPIARARLAAAVAEEILGPDGVQVRWEKWLRDGFDTDTSALDEVSRLDRLSSLDGENHIRWQGRGARVLAGMQQLKPIAELVDKPGIEALLRSKHCYVGPGGCIMPGTCGGIIFGKVGDSSVDELWQRLADDYSTRNVVGTLARLGVGGLLKLAEQAGFVPAEGYASKCHLCWQVRAFFAGKQLHCDELGPGWMYDES